MGPEDFSTDIDYAEAMLRSGIQDGLYVPAQRLIESDLIKQTGIKRAVIREALRRLESDGLVHIEKNRGATVRFISREEVADILEMLEVVTIFMLKKIAVRSKENRKALGKILSSTRQFNKRLSKINAVHEYLDENAHFWGALCDIAGNKLLSKTRLRLQTPLFRLSIQSVTLNSDRERWIKGHEELVLALIDGDEKRATRIGEKSCRDTLDAMLALPERAFGTNSSPES